LTTGDASPAEAGNFSLRHRVQMFSGAHPASCPMGNRVLSPGLEAGHSALSSRDVRMRGAIPPLPEYVFRA